MNTTFPRLLQQHASQRPGDAALREKEYGIWQTLDWAGLQAMVARMSHVFARDGMQRGDHVVIVGANRPRLSAAMLAVQSLGGIPVPLRLVVAITAVLLSQAGSQPISSLNPPETQDRRGEETGPVSVAPRDRALTSTIRDGKC